MTIEECYSIMGGDWDGIKRRLGNDALIAKLSLKFLSAKEYSEIGDAINNRDWEKAFLNAHTLKGVALNLGYNELAKAASALTELLRPRKLDNPREAERLYLSITSEHNKVINAINIYKESNL